MVHNCEVIGLWVRIPKMYNFKCYVINKGVIYKFYWSPMEYAGLWWTPVNSLVHWSPVDLISGKVWSKSGESGGLHWTRLANLACVTSHFLMSVSGLLIYDKKTTLYSSYK